MGITIIINAGTFIDNLFNEGIIQFHKFLWEKFKKHPIYLNMDKIEKMMALELYELVTFGKSKI